LYCATPAVAPEGVYPDDWYQGLVSFSDNISQIDTVTGLQTDIYQTSPKYPPLDIYTPALSPDSRYFVFINKTDLTLWAYKLPQGQ
jgi:hypothetical protein